MIHSLQRSDLFRGYRQAFETMTGLPLALRRIGSFQVPLHGSKRANAFCGRMAQSNPTCAACLQLQQRVELEATNEPKTLECFAGLSETAIPVRVGTRLIGHLQTGQVFLQPPERKRFRGVMRVIGWRGTDTAMGELEQEYAATRTVEPKHYESVIRLLSIFAEQLSLFSNRAVVAQTMAELPTIAKARTYIAAHHREEMRLHDVARAVSLSDYYFCKLFRRTTGWTFTDYLAKIRVEDAKEVLLRPQVRITEAAYAAGFQSLSQFNRVFRRVANETPTDFRDEAPGPALPPTRGAACPRSPGTAPSGTGRRAAA